jgi:hypothetical protein
VTKSWEGAVVLALAALALIATPATAEVRTVDFESVPAGSDVTDQYKADRGVFWIPSDPGSLPYVRSAPAQARSGSQVADFKNCEGGDCEFYNPATLARLTRSALGVAAHVGHLGPKGSSAQIHLRAYDTNGAQVASAGPVTVTGGSAFTKRLEVTVPMPTIARFRLVAPAGADINEDLAMDALAVTYPDAPPPPDFSLSTPVSVSGITQGSSVTIPVDVGRINGSNGDVSFEVSGLPEGVTASFAPNPVAGADSRTVMTLTADRDAPPFNTATELTITGTPGPGAGSAPRTVRTQVYVRENCARRIQFPYVDARTEDCLVKEGDEYHATNTEVRLNGLVIRPADDSRPTLVIDPVKKLVKGEEITMPFTVAVAGEPEIPIYAGPIRTWDFSKGGTGAREVIGLDVNKLRFLKGLPIRSLKAAFLPNARAEVTPTLKLGFWPFNYFGTLTASTTFTVGNDQEPDFSGLVLKLAEVNAVGLRLEDVALKWRAGGTWSGDAKIVLPFANDFTLEAGMGIKDGEFDYARGGVLRINKPIGSGVYLQSIQAEVHRSPLSIQGTVGVSAGPAVKGKTAVAVTGGLKAVLDDPFVIEVNGSLRIADLFDLGNAFVRYSSTGLFEFGGEIGWDFWRLDFDGSVRGWVDGLDAFNVEGSVEAELEVWGPNPSGDAKVLVSSKGLAGCIGTFGYHVGAGATWDFDFDAFTGCDLKPYREERPKQRRLRAAAELSRTTLPRGLTSAAWEVTGQGMPPNVTLTGPGGETVTVTRELPAVQNDRFHAHLLDDGTAFVLVKRPAAGVWTLSDDGSVPITRVREARGLPRPSARAAVRGRGRSRVLSWSLAPVDGQRVQFVEAGKDVRSVITSTSSRRGSVRFRPADGRAGKRRIVALVEQDGQPRTTLTAGSYRAPGPPRPGKPRQLRIRRSGSRLVVGWRPSPAGFRHAVHLTLSDGRQLVRFVPARRRSVTIKGIARSLGARARVYALSDANARGPGASVSIRRR